jgi:hypothetical protein
MAINDAAALTGSIAKRGQGENADAVLFEIQVDGENLKAKNPSSQEIDEWNGTLPR